MKAALLADGYAYIALSALNVSAAALDTSVRAIVVAVGAGNATFVSERINFDKMYPEMGPQVLDVAAVVTTGSVTADIAFTNNATLCVSYVVGAYARFVGFDVSLFPDGRSPVLSVSPASSGVSANATSHCVRLVTPVNGRTYYVTVRAQTECSALLTNRTSNGVMYDAVPPVVKWITVGYLTPSTDCSEVYKTIPEGKRIVYHLAASWYAVADAHAGVRSVDVVFHSCSTPTDVLGSCKNLSVTATSCIALPDKPIISGTKVCATVRWH